MAGHDRPRRTRFTDEQCLKALRAAARRLGRTPQIEEYRRFARGDASPRPHPVTIHNRFGSWPNAIETAGLEWTGVRHGFTDEECLEALRAAAKPLGRAPTMGEYEAFARAAGRVVPRAMTVAKRFGRWPQAVGAAGLKPQPTVRGFTDEECLEALRAAAKPLGRAPKTDEYRIFARATDDTLPNPQTISRHFGGWPHALRAAGL